MWNSYDLAWMRQALNLAAKAKGRTRPNPMVGAVLVRQGKVVGQGWHRKAGGPHAESMALRQAGPDAKGATLYCTLEPCNHQGRTPACAPAITAAGVVRVVVAMQDPNPLVAGRGLRFLRRAGIQVELGCCRAQAQELNRVFIKWITTGRPYVICKAALSLDGKIACFNGSSRWISGRTARHYAHGLRAEADAILVGMGTVIQDDPELSVRGRKSRGSEPPLRVVLEGSRSLPPSARLLNGARVIVASSRKGARAKAVADPRIETWYLHRSRGRVDLAALLLRLGKRGVNLLLVEGGAQVFAEFLGLSGPGSALWADEVQFIVAPRLIGGTRAPSVIGGQGADHPSHGVQLLDLKISALGQDWLFRGKPGKREHTPRRK